jgi:hypothetical protein
MGLSDDPPTIGFLVVRLCVGRLAVFDGLRHD